MAPHGRVALGRLARELVGPRRGVRAEVGAHQAGSGEQGEVVRRGHLAGGVQPAGVHRVGVVGLQLDRDLVHALDGRRPAAGGVGERAGRVVPGREEEPVEQLVHRVRQPRHDADLGALDPGVLGPADVHLGLSQPWQHGERGQRLERAGRQEPAVRVLGCQHRAGGGVGDQPGPCAHGGQRGLVGAGHHPGAGEQVAPDRAGRDALPARLAGGGTRRAGRARHQRHGERQRDERRQRPARGSTGSGRAAHDARHRTSGTPRVRPRAGSSRDEEEVR